MQTRTELVRRKDIQMLRIPEFCERYAQSRSAVYREIAAGRLRITKISSATRIKIEDAEAWASSLPTQGGEASNG